MREVMASIQGRFLVFQPIFCYICFKNAEVFLHFKNVLALLNICYKNWLPKFFTSGRIPFKVERLIAKLLSNYEQNLTSILAQFPAQQITAHLLGYLSSLHPREKDMAELVRVDAIISITFI